MEHSKDKKSKPCTNTHQTSKYSPKTSLRTKSEPLENKLGEMAAPGGR